MKKIIFTLALCILAATATAQKLGITGNIAFDRAQTTILQGISPSLGWSLGLKFRYVSAVGLGFDAAAKYTSEGRSYGDGMTGSSTRASFISIPVNLRYDLQIPAISGMATPFVFVGPEFSWAVDGHEWYNTASKDIFEENKTIWNLNFGFGVLLSKRFEITYNYTMQTNDRFSGGALWDAITHGSTGLKTSSNKIGLTYYF